MAGRNLLSLYTDIEVPLIPILRRMTRHGALVNKELVRQMQAEVTEQRAVLFDTICAVAGQPFNPASNAETATILFEKLGLEPRQFNKSGPVVDQYVLEDLDHPLAALIMEWRNRNKLLGTYIEPLLAGGERVHGTFNQFITRTGRLSSSGPNLQNPDQRIRAAYEAPVGGVLLCGDYSQQELRVLAHYSREPEWLRWFQEGIDPHKGTASTIYGVSLVEVIKPQRDTAKLVNFGIAYGSGPKTLGKSLPGGVRQGAQLIESHKATFPILWGWIDHWKDVCRERGYSDTLWGRRRWLPELNSELPEERWKAERNAVNMPIQGSSADITKLAMVRVQYELDSGRWPGVTMILQVHDELVFECADPDVALRFKPVLEDIMEGVGVGVLDVPLKVDAHIGKTWAEAKG